jgi:hypothetical protein
LCCNKDNKTERRFFIVEKRDRQTLLPIIEREVEIGTTIDSDQWGAYSSLKDHRFIHQTVNHSENFVDPNTGAHTQTIVIVVVKLISIR